MASLVTEPERGRKSPPQEGRGSNGMWWVAWRQHRLWVLVCCAPFLVISAVLAVMRAWYISVIPTGPAVCDPKSFDWVACERIMAQAPPLATVWALVRLAMISLPTVIGALAGGMLIAQERDRGTQVFALSQSVGRSRWYLTKCLVLLGPSLAAAVVAGLAGQWVIGVPGAGLWSGLETPDFQATGIVPAALLLLSFGLSVPVGATLRSLPAVLTTTLLISATAVIALGFFGYKDLVPHDRVVGPVAAEVNLPAGALYLGHEYLDSSGQPMTPVRCAGLDQKLSNAGNPAEVIGECYRSQGISQESQIYLDTARYPQLIATLAGICTALAAAGLTLGLWILRRRVL